VVSGEPPDVDRWAAEVRDDATIAERARAASLRRQLALEVTLGGVLVDAAEHGHWVEVGLRGAAPVTGVVAAVGRDHVQLRAGADVVLVATAHLTWVRGLPGAPLRVPGERAVPGGGALAARLRTLAEEAAHVRVATADGTRLEGRVVGAGDDVLVVDVPPHGPTYLPSAALAAVWTARG